MPFHKITLNDTSVPPTSEVRKSAITLLCLSRQPPLHKAYNKIHHSFTHRCLWTVKVAGLTDQPYQIVCSASAVVQITLSVYHQLYCVYLKTSCTLFRPIRIFLTNHENLKIIFFSSSHILVLQCSNEKNTFEYNKSLTQE